MNFPWLSPTDNCTPSTTTAAAATTESMSCNHYRTSPLVHWLLPSSGLGTDLQNTRHVTATHHCVMSLRTQRKHCSCIVGRTCVAGVA
jgi:hypothetical protein